MVMEEREGGGKKQKVDSGQAGGKEGGAILAVAQKALARAHMFTREKERGGRGRACMGGWASERVPIKTMRYMGATRDPQWAGG